MSVLLYYLNAMIHSNDTMPNAVIGHKSSSSAYGYGTHDQSTSTTFHTANHQKHRRYLIENTMRCRAFDLSSLLTIWIISITLHLSAADVHICDDTSACDSSIVCAPGESCIVTCTAAYSCKNMQIACPEDNPCEVHCSNRWMLDVSESMRTSLGAGLHTLNSTRFY